MSAPITIDDDDIEMPLAPAGFYVHDEKTAAWALEKVLDHRHRVLRLERQAEKNLARAERELKRAEEFFGPMLKAYYTTHPPVRGKTVHLPTGDIGTRTQPGGIFVDDEEACREWAEKNLPEAIRREVLVKLDVMRARREGERIFGEAFQRKFLEVPRDEVIPDAADKTQQLLNAAAAELPPGMVRRQDVEVFEMKAPKGGK